MNLSTLRQNLSDALASTVVSTPKLTCTPYVPDSVLTPHLYIQPDTITFDRAMTNGMAEIMLTVYVLVSRSDDKASQQLLDGYLAGSGSQSIRAALNAARGAPGVAALSGACDDLHLVSAQAYQWYLFGDTRYLGCSFTVRCIGTGA